jgi:hypothetical protein
MVATERIRRAETEEELKETRLEKEALQSALRVVVEGENRRFRGASITSAAKEEQLTRSQSVSSGEQPRSFRSRSSSRVGVKSRPSSLKSLSLPPLSPQSSKSALELSNAGPASPSPPPEPSGSTSTPLVSPAPTSEELTPHDTSRIPHPAPFLADEQLAWANVKPKPPHLHVDSLFPVPTPFSR